MRRSTAALLAVLVGSPVIARQHLKLLVNHRQRIACRQAGGAR